MAKSKKAIHQLTISEFEGMFPNEEACCAYLVARRWPEGVYCPRCGNLKVYALPSRPWHWQCEACTADGYRFSHIAGTIFENTNKPLRDWFRVVHMMVTAKKGVSALQVKRVMGFGSYETAWSMCHKIRTALVEDTSQLGGIVEVDETWVGGKAKNKHRGPGGRGGMGGTGMTGKEVVVGAVKRKGNVVARVIERVDAATLREFIREAVSTKVSLLCTDKSSLYKKIGTEFPHAAVDHKRGEYVVGAVHTNTIEGFWSQLKRSMVGTFHKVSPKYLPLYVAECAFKYNNRMNDDIFGAAISGC